MFVGSPVQAGLVGGSAAYVNPPRPQSIGQATAVMVSGGALSWNIGEGKLDTGSLLNVSLVGSIAKDQGTVASNSRSTAWLCSWSSLVIVARNS